MAQLGLRVQSVFHPLVLILFNTPMMSTGRSYAAKAYSSAPTNAIASSKVKLEISLPVVV
jgi:hypothetical protein